MRFDFTVHADTPTELRDVLAAVQDALPANLFERPTRSFRIDVSPSLDDFEQDVVRDGHTVYPAAPVERDPAMPSHPHPTPADGCKDDPAPAKRTRRTKAEMEAARAAEASAAQPDPGPQAQDEGDDEAAPVPVAEAVAAATAAAVEAVAEPTPAPELSPGDAKLKALDTLRTAYALPGGPAGVKVIQKDYGVAKFVEVPDARGVELLAVATTLLAKLEAAAPAPV